MSASQALTHKGRPNPERPQFASGSVAFRKTSSELGNTLEVLGGQLADLNREIRADRLGKKEFEDQMGLLRRAREKLQANHEANAKWAKGFDEAIGPFERKYANLTVEIGGLYKNVKAEHAKGIELLIDEFSYHPVFKRWNDTFSAIPFRPK